ncbi:MAG: PA14 domain-containing protein, partial [Dehalococcoidia bacterium]
YGESSYPTEDGLFIDHYTLPPSPDDPGRTYRNVFSNHYGYDINHISQDTCSLGSRGCTPTFNVIAGTQLNSADPIRFGSDWKTTNAFFDIQDWDGNISGLPESFRLTRPDQPRPSRSAFRHAGLDAWVDPAHPQPSEWPMPPTIQWTSSPSSFGSGSATFTASASGFSTSRGDVEIFVDEFEDGTPWKAEYYDNTNLAGRPIELEVSEIGFSYRNGSPLGGTIEANNWSGRFTNTFVSAGGSHRIEIQANDGVRLYLDGKLLFQEWTKLTSCCTSQFSTTLNIPAGSHTVVIEYFDDTTDTAVLAFDLHRVVTRSSLSKSLTIDAADWPRKYAHVYARAHDPISGLYAYTPVVKLRNPRFSEPARPSEPAAPKQDPVSTDLVLLVSNSGDRSGEHALTGSTLKGDVYVFAGPEDKIRQVDFYVDDPNMNGELIQLERSAPYDLMGGSTSEAAAFDTRQLSDGQHSITAVIETSSGQRSVVTAAFLVANGGSSGQYSLLMSRSQGRANAVTLDGRTVSGDIYIFADSGDGISSVTFWLNDTGMSGSPFQVENLAPYDMAGGSTDEASSFDTSTLNNGYHYITVLVEQQSGPAQVLTAKFRVSNS